MIATIIHLSDMHIDSKLFGQCKDIGSRIGHAAKQECTSSDVVVIALTGDIAFKGCPDEFSAAGEMIAEIRSIIQKELHKQVLIAACPGNHDVDMSKNDSVRNLLIRSAENGQDFSIDDTIVDALTKPQDAFFKFACAAQANIGLCGFRV